MHFRGDLPTMWVDNMRIARRDDPPISTLSFFAAFPENPDQRMEVTRIMTSERHLKQIIDVLCRVTGHYPKEEKVKGSG